MASNEPVIYNHKQYLRGGYVPGWYGTEEEVVQAIAVGKVFVFRQSLGYRVVGWGLFALGVCVLWALFWSEATSGDWAAYFGLTSGGAILAYFIWVFSLWGFISAWAQFVVVGPRGIVWRTRRGVRALSWQQVTSVTAWITDTTMYSTSGTWMSRSWGTHIDTAAGQRYKIFPSYRNREFPRSRGWEFMAKTIALCWEYFHHKL